MIVKTAAVSHTHNLGVYLLGIKGDKNEDVQISQRGLITDLGIDPRPWRMHTAVNEMDIAASGNTRLKRPVIHAIINPDTDSSSEMQPRHWRYAWKQYEKEYGLEKQPFIEAKHRTKTGRVHVHRMYQRVRTSGTSVELDFSHKRNQKVARILEHDFKHEITHGPHNRWVMKKLKKSGERPEISRWMHNQGAHEIVRPHASMTTAEHRREIRTQMKIETVEKELQDAWNSSESGKEFHEKITKKGYELLLNAQDRPVVRDPDGQLHGLRTRLWLDKEGKPGTRKLDKKLQAHTLNLPKLEERPRQLDPDKLTPEQKYRYEELERREQQLDEKEETLIKTEHDLNYRQQQIFKERDEVRNLKKNYRDRDKELDKREEAISKREENILPSTESHDDKSLNTSKQPNNENAVTEFHQSIYEEQVRKKEEARNKNLAEKAPMNGKYAKLRDALDDPSGDKFNQLNRELKHEDFQLNGHDTTENRPKSNPKSTPPKKTSSERKTLASLKLRHNWDRQELKHKASQFKKPKKTEIDSPMRHFRKSAETPRHQQPSTDDPVKPELNLEPPPIKRMKYYDILLLKGSTQNHLLASLDQKGAGLDVSQFSKQSAKIIDGYHDRVAAAAQEQVGNKIQEYNDRYNQLIKPINARYKHDLAKLITQQKSTYQDHLHSEQSLMKRMAFGLRQAGAMRLLKYMTNREYRQDYFEKRFEREKAALKRPFQKQVNKIKNQLTKELQADVKAIRRQQDKENKQLPKIRNQVRQEEFKMSLEREHSQISRGRVSEQKTSVKIPDISELETQQPLVSEKSLNEISTLAKDAQSQFNPDKPANDHQTRADSILAKINSARNNSSPKHENIPEIRPSLI